MRLRFFEKKRAKNFRKIVYRVKALMRTEKVIVLTVTLWFCPFLVLVKFFQKLALSRRAALSHSAECGTRFYAFLKKSAQKTSKK